MKISENNKFFAWLVSAFPNWNVGQATAAIWAKELPDVPAEIVIEAVRRLQANDPKPFPPGVFEIIGALKGRVDPHRDGMIAFATFWELAGGSRPPVNLSAKAKEAFRIATGGRGYGDALTADRSWHEKRFCEIYEGLSEREAISGPLLPDGSDGRRALSEGSKAIPGPDKIKAIREKVEARIAELYPSGKVPAEKIGEVKAMISGLIKGETVGLGPEKVGSIVEGVLNGF